MKSSFWLAVAAYLAPTFLLAYFWHLAIFGEAYQQLSIYRADVIIPMGFVSMVIQGMLFATAYPRLFGTRRDAWRPSAFAFGGTASLLAWSYTVLPVAAKYEMSSVADFVLLETGFTILQFSLVAPLIALSYRETAASPMPATTA